MFITSTVRNKIMEKIGDNITTVITTDIQTHVRDDWGDCSPVNLTNQTRSDASRMRIFHLCQFSVMADGLPGLNDRQSHAQHTSYLSRSIHTCSDMFGKMCSRRLHDPCQTQYR